MNDRAFEPRLGEFEGRISAFKVDLRALVSQAGDKAYTAFASRFLWQS
jgi:hypothetical protein